MLALVAGQGGLPAILLAQVTGPVTVAALEGFPPEVDVDLIFRVEQLGSFLNELDTRGVDRVCFAGSLARPALDPEAVDAATLPYVERIIQSLQKGDDGALREVLSIFEERGFQVVAAHEVAPALLPGTGVATKQTPSVQDEKDAARAGQILKATAEADIGQGCVVSHGQALAVEALGGTDWMLETLANDRPKAAAPGGIFAKAPKPGQDRRVDLPVVGPDTVRAVARAGLNGLVIEAGGVMVLDWDNTVRLANEHELFLWVREAD
ncbi:LpxI family protein [Actibacterium pelagium]|uniref:Phosphatidate cytidylyltransferase n=1 Tax=Actibacterium pelagium TaxID=2029103 RepID=A0A917EIY7_9RHOB|nr:UDP-2,3-diacylglucosamine diphosphatase LpxI [Actibacterium pelagium]GGE42347.1 phosphatidate cytidylyltransferase [Actibacterium pelagium]